MAAVIDLFGLFRTRVLATLMIVASLLATTAFGQQVQDESALTITEIAGDLYRVQIGTAATVFLVTPEGIILGDPLDRNSAVRLKDELTTRFPDRPVRYVILSHHEFLRAEGVSVFGDTADAVAQRAFNAELSKARRELPSWLAPLDQNHDQMLERGELADTALAGVLSSRDWNGDGIVTTQELYRLTLYVKTSYLTPQVITLGDKRVVMVHPGPFHAADMAILSFPTERVVFAADVPPLNAVPFSVASISSIKDAVEWFAVVMRLDFDTLLTGDGQAVSRREIARAKQYIDELWRGVVDGYKAGKTLGELQAGPLLSTYQGDAQFSERSRDIAYAYGRLWMLRVDLHVTGGPAFLADYADYCRPLPSQLSPAWGQLSLPETYETCDAAGGRVPAGTIGLSVSRGRRALLLEWRSAGQVLTSRTSALYDDSFAHRETTVSALVGYTLGPRAGFRYQAMIGWSQAFDRSASLQVFKGHFDPCCHQFSESATSRGGITAGFDLVRPLGTRLSLLLPVRVTRFLGDTYSNPVTSVVAGGPVTTATVWPGRTTIQIGVGFAYGFIQFVK